MANLPEYLAYAFMVSDQIMEYQDEYNVSFGDWSDLFGDIQFSNEWLADAEAFVDDYIADYGNTLLRSEKTPDSINASKSEAITYAIECAQASKKRNSNIDINKEAQYTFISHYVDRNDYYWSSQDEKNLLDGPSQSGPNGVLADRLTTTDRKTYSNYIAVTGVTNSMQNLGHIAEYIYGIVGSTKSVREGYDFLERGKTIT